MPRGEHFKKNKEKPVAIPLESASFADDFEANYDTPLTPQAAEKVVDDEITMDDLYATIKSLQEKLERANLRIEKQEQESREASGIVPSVEHTGDFEDVIVYVPSANIAQQGLTKRTGYDSDLQETYEYIEIQAGIIPPGETEHKTRRYSIRLDCQVRVPKFVALVLGDRCDMHPVRSDEYDEVYAA